MKLNQLAGKHGATKARRRVGRGRGSGLGKTSGHGQKGQKSRTGVALGGFEGGQMPIHMRLPKRGFNNIFRKRYQELTLGRLQAVIDAGRVDPKKPLTAAVLKEAGVIRRVGDGVRLLGGGELKAKLTIEVAGATKAAAAAIEKAGGSLVMPEVKAPAKFGKRQQRRVDARAKREARAAGGNGGEAPEKSKAKSKSKAKAEPKEKSEKKA